jgi:hypothetical protein
MNGFYLMHVKTAFESFVKNGVYWIDHNALQKVPAKLVDIYHSEIIKQYTNQQTLILNRAGGIGDIIALSSLVGIADNTIVLTQNKYKPINAYFQEPCSFKGFNEPLFMADHN